jgi:hypothetical protein
MLIFPLADGEKNMRFFMVLKGLQTDTTLHGGNAAFMAYPYLLKGFNMFGSERKFYNPCQGNFG